MKKQIENQPFIPVMPVVIVATKDSGKVNFAPYGQSSQICYKPATISVSMIKGSTTEKTIEKTGHFSVNIPRASMLEKVKYCGSVHGSDVDKSSAFEVYYGKNDIPLIKDCPINLNCKVVQTMDIHNLRVFLAEIIETFVEEEFFEGDVPDMLKVDPLLCSFNGFWSLKDGFVEK